MTSAACQAAMIQAAWKLFKDYPDLITPRRSGRSAGRHSDSNQPKVKVGCLNAAIQKAVNQHSNRADSRHSEWANCSRLYLVFIAESERKISGTFAAGFDR